MEPFVNYVTCFAAVGLFFATVGLVIATRALVEVTRHHAQHAERMAAAAGRLAEVLRLHLLVTAQTVPTPHRPAVLGRFERSIYAHLCSGTRTNRSAERS
jgi:hypothetical protein